MKRTLTALILTGVATAAIAGPAGDGPARSGPPMPPMPPIPPGPELHFLDVMGEKIGLSEDQEERIEALVDSFRLDSAEDRERLSQIREEMQDIARKDEFFDENALTPLVDEMSGITSRMATNGAELRWKIRQVLTEEQREQLDALRGRHHHRFVHFQESDI